jgi:uncharacterized membrane protein
MEPSLAEFALALAAFFAIHALPAATGLRGRAIARFGRRPYIAVYSLVSLASLGWVIVATLRAPYVELWAPRPATALVAVVAMLPACLLFAAAVTRPNPVSISFVGGPADASAPGILALTRHPVLWAFLLWAASHAVANGDLVAFVLFAGFALFALAGMPLLEQRARRRGEAAAFDLAAGPWGRRLARALSPRLALELAAGAALYAAVALAHEPVIGVDPFAWL